MIVDSVVYVVLELAGQLVTVLGQAVIVSVVVEYNVTVVYDVVVLEPVAEPELEEPVG